MRISRTTYRIGAVAGTIGVALALAAPIAASTPSPAGMSKAGHRALMLRSEALNRQYHLGTYSRVPQGMSADEYRALLLRSGALNKKHHLGNWAVSPASTTLSATRGFSWSAFGIGATAMLAVVVLAGGAVVGGRYGWGVPRTRIFS